jgi:hypothetical protein
MRQHDGFYHRQAQTTAFRVQLSGAIIALKGLKQEVMKLLGYPVPILNQDKLPLSHHF